MSSVKNVARLFVFYVHKSLKIGCFCVCVFSSFNYSQLWHCLLMDALEIMQTRSVLLSFHWCVCVCVWGGGV